MAGALLPSRFRVQTLAKAPGFRRLLPVIAERLIPGGYYFETARVKHIDRILLTELSEGLDQLVILGAGYDSRPYRFRDALDGVRVYEVDLPEVSDVKRRRATRALGQRPANLHYVAADLVRGDLRNRLEEHAYRLDAPTLLVLSGVAPYLPEPAVHRLFRFACSHTDPRSSIVFDYVFREMLEGADSFHGASQTRRRLRALGEPLMFGISIDGTAQWVERFGMTLLSDVRADDLARQYLLRADGTVAGKPYGFAAVAHARVKGESAAHGERTAQRLPSARFE